jgi:hypothetical protein
MTNSLGEAAQSILVVDDDVGAPVRSGTSRAPVGASVSAITDNDVSHSRHRFGACWGSRPGLR